MVLDDIVEMVLGFACAVVLLALFGFTASFAILFNVFMLLLHYYRYKGVY